MRGWPKLGYRWGSQSWRLRARVSAAPQASSSSVESGDCPSPTAYWWSLNVHVCRPNASTRPLHVQSNPFSQSSCISILAEGGFLTLVQRFVADIATRCYHTLQLTPQAQKKTNTTSRSWTKTISIKPWLVYSHVQNSPLIACYCPLLAF